jgi:hypothetical protein
LVAASDDLCPRHGQEGVREQPGTVQGAAGALIRLSVAEVRRLLWKLVFAVEQTAAEVLAWSRWRRRHQAVAKFSHYKRRGALAHLQL